MYGYTSERDWESFINGHMHYQPYSCWSVILAYPYIDRLKDIFFFSLYFVFSNNATAAPQNDTKRWMGPPLKISLPSFRYFIYLFTFAIFPQGLTLSNLCRIQLFLGFRYAVAAHNITQTSSSTLARSNAGLLLINFFFIFITSMMILSSSQL